MAQADMDVINSNPKLAGIDLEKILTPAEELRPGAAQRCVMAQVQIPLKHPNGVWGLDSGVYRLE